VQLPATYPIVSVRVLNRNIMPHRLNGAIVSVDGTACATNVQVGSGESNPNPSPDPNPDPDPNPSPNPNPNPNSNPHPVRATNAQVGAGQWANISCVATGSRARIALPSYSLPINRFLTLCGVEVYVRANSIPPPPPAVPPSPPSPTPLFPPPPFPPSMPPAPPALTCEPSMCTSAGNDCCAVPGEQMT
jgi:hypothetical protein